MNSSVVRALIWTDWERHRFPMLLSVACGVAALGLLQVGGEIPSFLGAIWFFTTLVVLGCLLPVSNVVNERKKQILPFLMSLPLSATQFATAKLVSTVGMYLVPWLMLVAGAEVFILGHPGYSQRIDSRGAHSVDGHSSGFLPDRRSGDGQRI